MKKIKRIIILSFLLILSGALFWVAGRQYYHMNFGWIPALSLLILAALVLYLFWELSNLSRKFHSNEKQLRRLRYLFSVEKKLNGTHADPNCLVETLKEIAAYLSAEETFCVVLGQEQWFWSSQDDSPLIRQNLMELFRSFYPVLLQSGGFVSYNMAFLKKELSQNNSPVSSYNIKNVMLLPIPDLDGQVPAVLGARNMSTRWKDTSPLADIVPSFSLALNHRKMYLTVSRMGQIDTLTGLKNRNSYDAVLEKIKSRKYMSFACIYIDANGLHEINNHLGHQAGDEMLKTVAETIQQIFVKCLIFRIGGDEFVILCENMSRKDVCRKAEQVRQRVEEQDYALSVGIKWSNEKIDIDAIVTAAESSMQKDKEKYYKNQGGERQIRALDQQLEQMLLEKQDADTFLSVLAPEFRGVYFVNITNDTVRHLYIPSYFREMLNETHDKFSDALILYARRLAREEYFPRFHQFCNYDYLRGLLKQGTVPEFTYQKKNGEWLLLKVLKFKDYTETEQETLWIFSIVKEPGAVTN